MAQLQVQEFGARCVVNDYAILICVNEHWCCCLPVLGDYLGELQAKLAITESQMPSSLII